MRRLLAAIALLPLGHVPAYAQVSFGMSGAAPAVLCVYDRSATRPCVTIGSIDSTAHTFASTPQSLAVVGAGTFGGSATATTFTSSATGTVSFGGGATKGVANDTTDLYLRAPGATGRILAERLFNNGRAEVGAGRYTAENGPSSVVDLYTGGVGGVPTTPMRNYVGLSGGGAVFSKFDITGAVPGDHDRAANYLKMTTSVDATAANGETNLTLNTVSNTGASTVWATSTAYTNTSYVRKSDSNNVYHQTVASCTSAAAGVGPTGTGSGIADNDCSWDWVNANALNYTAGIYNGTMVYPNARVTWGLVNNYLRMSGADKAFAPGLEFDYSGDSTDCVIGIHNCYNLYMGMNGGPGTAWIAMSGQPASAPYSAHYGLLISGDHAADSASVSESSVSAYGFQSGTFGGTHSVAAFDSLSASARGFLARGGYTTAAFESLGGASTPLSFHAFGTTTTAAFKSAGTTPLGYSATGTYSTAAYEANGAATTPTGFLVAATSTTTAAAFASAGTTVNAFDCRGTVSFACLTIFATVPHGINITNPNTGIGVHFAGARTGPDIDDASTTAIGANFRGTYSTTAVKLPSLQFTYTAVAGLPTCDATHDGVVRAVSDASAPTWGATVAGGGAVKTLVLCNATNWLVN